MQAKSKQQILDEYRDRATRESTNVAAVAEYQRLVWAVQGAIGRLQQHLERISSTDTELIEDLNVTASLLPSRSNKAQEWLNEHTALSGIYTEAFLKALLESDRS